ncbi:hypothetical protein ZHAS_00007736 [Anopheles sinensis]|uniref:Uncharacterized protein n=1 Tax=Anopheles sinensis TaxID=74873 RepID=A0A084VQM6_ANOSI|nr:hypothetical protein ZHAS_00007736 [Anopheles sinensis]
MVPMHPCTPITEWTWQAVMLMLLLLHRKMHRKCTEYIKRSIYTGGGCVGVLSRNVVRAATFVRVGEFVGNWQFDAETNSDPLLPGQGLRRKEGLVAGNVQIGLDQRRPASGSMHSRPARVTMTMMKLIWSAIGRPEECAQ